ncbi:conserved hypothetical protein [Gammaproteobacteria bacterium]
MSAQIDLLLINISNLASQPVFPYAFVQVTAIARRYGVQVARIELCDIPDDQIEIVLRLEIERTTPRMIGIHLRQLDTLQESDYRFRINSEHVPSRINYFPVALIERIVYMLRGLTSAPIAIGGFGFTTFAELLIDRIKPDFGIVGEPDAFFAQFKQVLSGKSLNRIANLIFRENGIYHFNSRQCFGPSAEPEYDDTLINELRAFYQHHSEGKTNSYPLMAAIEIARGCPHSCFFCVEPRVMGRKVNKRNLDIVMEDVRFIADRGIHWIWFVCSEINADGNNNLLHAIANRMQCENVRRGSQPIAWTAYLLPVPVLNSEEIETLIASGFTPGWNSFLSFDDVNLTRSRVPYRATHALRSQCEWAYAMHQHEIARNPQNPSHQRFDMFLGTPIADATTISNTLRKYDAAGLQQWHHCAQLTRATRLFPPIANIKELHSDPCVITVGPSGRLPKVDLTYPTFHYPPALVQALGGQEEYHRFFDYLESTFFSFAHRLNKNWAEFLRVASLPRLLRIWLAGIDIKSMVALQSNPLPIDTKFGTLANQIVHGEIPNEQAFNIFWESSQYPVADPINEVAGFIVSLIVSNYGKERALALNWLAIPHDANGNPTVSEYLFLEHLYRNYQSRKELVAAVSTTMRWNALGPEIFSFRELLYHFNVILRPDYRNLLFGPDFTAPKI